MMLNLYTETNFPVKASTPGSLHHIELPSKNPSEIKNQPQKRRRDRLVRTSDEQTFAKQYLASASSIYFRHTKTYPRTFLWRVLRDSRSLEIQCADTARSASDQKEAHLTLSLDFPNAILPSGVALADGDRGDIISIFVLTESRELYTLSLHTNFFQSAQSIPEDVSTWCHIESPSALTFDRPHLLYANTPYELFISFESGRLQRLSRKADSHIWVQENYDEKPWTASLRDWVSRSGPKPILYESRYLNPLTTHSMVASTDSTHLYTICLNHTLRVWNVASGRLVASKDLLDTPRNPQESVYINPAQSLSLKVFKLAKAGPSILASYSPLEGGQFKFWNINGGLTGPLLLEDRYPKTRLAAPDPDPSGNTLWSLTGFDIISSDAEHRFNLWLLWRNNNFHRLYSLRFDPQFLSNSWNKDWVQSAVPRNRRSAVPDSSKSTSNDMVSEWLDCLVRSKQYPVQVLETALLIYQEATAQSLAAAESKSLSERICSVVGANVALRKYGEGEMDYSRFTSDTDFQWRNLWRIVESLNETRLAPLSLAVDAFNGMVWLTMSDTCSAVRECSSLELMQHNEIPSMDSLESLTNDRWPYRRFSADGGEPLSRITGLISAATTFSSAFSPELDSDFELEMDEETLVDGDIPISHRIDDIYEHVDFGTRISNETFKQLEQNLEQIGGLSSINNDLFYAILDHFNRHRQRPESALRSTVFGANMLSTGLRELVRSRCQLVIDLAALAIFIAGEMSSGEFDCPEFDAPELVEHLISVLRDYKRDVWLTKHTREVPLEFPGQDTSPNYLRKDVPVVAQNARTVTVMEDAISKAMRPQPSMEKPQTYMLTELLEDTEAYINGHDQVSAEDVTTYVLCDLIARGDLGLAIDFDHFLPVSGWALYVKAQLAIKRAEFSTASHYLQQAAHSLALGKSSSSFHEKSAGLISPLDNDSFLHGLPRYYQHIMSLFEASKAYSQAAKFARLALKSLQPGHKEPFTNFKSEILTRLFTAEIKCCRFPAAFETLVQFSDTALQKSSAIILVHAIFDSQAALSDKTDALRTFQSLPIALHPPLARHIDQYLMTQARKSKASTFFSKAASERSALSVDSSQIDYQSIVSAIHMAQKDFRGALPVLYDQLQSTRKSTRARSDPQATSIRQAYLALINTMSCIKQDEAYLLIDVEDQSNTHGVNGDMVMANDENAEQRKKRKRIIVTLEDLRREYQQVLDRCSRIERGDFAFDVVDGESDEDEEMEM